jgi:hypothetical protein
MVIWRYFLKFVDVFLSNPIYALALVVFGLVAINYKTLIANLPGSLPELENMIADLAPKTVTLEGSMTGAGPCWRMNFTFFEEDGSPLLDTRDHIGRLTQAMPSATLSLPHRSNYLLRLETEVPLADPATCLPIGTGVVLKSNANQTPLLDTSPAFRLVNTCDFAEANKCELKLF